MTAAKPETIQPQFRTVDGLSIRFAESEDRGDHALLLSPWPERLFAFDPMWARLAEPTPKSKRDLLDSGHFAWEDRADEYATLIASWWADGDATFGR